METFVEKSCEFRGYLTEAILSEGLKIPNYEHYTVHKEGFVVSHKKAPIILKGGKSGYNRNYHYVSLCKDGKSTSTSLHVLVAKAFVPNTENKPQVNHIDGDTSNNHYSNLEWTTALENSNHAVDSGLTLTGEACPWSVNSEVFIRSICECLQGKMSNKEIRATLGCVNPKLLWKIRHKKQWKQISIEYDF